MKILIFSDLHIHPHKRSTERLEDCLTTLKWVFETAIKNNIKNIVFLGDLFHDRQKIDVFTYQKTFEVFENYLINTSHELKIHLLLGNHDLWHFSKLDISSVNPLRSIPNVIVVDQACTIDIDGFQASFLPYTHDPIVELQNIKNNSKFKVLFSHLAVDGAILNKLSATHAEVALESDGEMTKVGSEIFKNWDRVFLGHYHTPQNLTDTVEYVGSTLQLTFSDAFDDKHVIIFDPETDTRQYIVNDFSPRHYITTSDKLEEYNLENNFVRVIVDEVNTLEIQGIKEKLENQTASLEIKIKPSQQNDHLIQDAKTILLREDTMLENYILEVDKNSGLNSMTKEKLLEIGKKICESRNE